VCNPDKSGTEVKVWWEQAKGGGKVVLISTTARNWGNMRWGRIPVCANKEVQTSHQF
jgi:hypothetical protein